MNDLDKERALKAKIIKTTVFILLGLTSCLLAQEAPAPELQPEPTYTAGSFNPILWSISGIPGVNVNAWEIWVDTAPTGEPDWPDELYEDTWGPADISINNLTNITVEAFGDTYGADYAYPIGIGGSGADADGPLASGVRYCFKVRYRWSSGRAVGFSDWSGTYCSTQDANPPVTDTVEALPNWVNASVVDIDVKSCDFICGGVDSIELWYRIPPDVEWNYYGPTAGPLFLIDDPSCPCGSSYTGSFEFDVTTIDPGGDNKYEFFFAGWDSLGNGVVPESTLHSSKAWTRVDDTDPESELNTTGLPEYFTGSASIELPFTANDEYSGVLAVYLTSDYGTGHDHYIDTIYFYGDSDVNSSFDFWVTANGEYNLRTIAEDSAGNIETDTIWHWTIYADTEKPTFTSVGVYDTTTIPHRYDVPALSGWTNDALVEVVPNSAQDPLKDEYASGIDSVIAASNSIFTQDYAVFDYDDTPYLWNTPDNDGDKVVYLKLEDAAGNQSEKSSGIITLDTEAPVLTNIELYNQATPGAETDTTVSLTVDVKAKLDTFYGTASGIFFTDDISALDSIGDDEWKPLDTIDSTYEFEFEGYSSGDWLPLYGVVRDSAGNVSVEVFDSIQYITGNKQVEIIDIRDIDGPDTTGRYTDTTLVSIRVLYGNGIDSILIWDDSSTMGAPDTAQPVPNPSGPDSTITITGKLDRIDGWHFVSIRGKANYDEILTAADIDSIELDTKKPTIGTFTVTDLTTSLESDIPADVADTGWTNDTLVKARFQGIRDTGGDSNDGTGIYHYRISTDDGSVLLSEGPYPLAINRVDFGLPVEEELYVVWGEIQDSAGNWSSEVNPDMFEITLDSYVPTISSVVLWDINMTSSEYTDSIAIAVQIEGEDGSRSPRYAAIFENPDDYPGNVKDIRVPHDTYITYTLSNTAEGLKTVYVALMDRAGNISAMDSATIEYTKKIVLDMTIFDEDSDPINTDCTNEKEVSVRLDYLGPTPSHYFLSEDPVPSDTIWVPYDSVATYKFDELEGEKILYGWLFSESGVISDVDIDTIYLDMTPPQMDEGFFVWDTTRTDNYPTSFMAAMGWSNEAYIYAHIPSEDDGDGCGTDSMKFSGDIELDMWGIPPPASYDSEQHTVDLEFSTDSIPLLINTDEEGQKQIVARLLDKAGNWGSTHDSSQITIYGGYDISPPEFHFLDVFTETETDEITTTKPDYLPLYVSDEPDAGFLWKVCWKIDNGTPECTVYDSTWDTPSATVFHAAFPSVLAEQFEADVHYALEAVVIDSAGNPSAPMTADLLILPDVVGFTFTVVDSNDTTDSDYCGERNVMTVINIANPPDSMRFGESPTALGDWRAYSPTDYFEITGPNNQWNQVYAQVRFGQKLSEIEVDSIILDMTAPSVGEIVAYDISSGDEIYSDELTIGFRATDAEDTPLGVVGALLVAEDEDFTVNVQKCEFTDIQGTTAYAEYTANEEPYFLEGTTPSGELYQDARTFWVKLLDRAENEAPQLGTPSIVIDLDEMTITNFPNPFNPENEPTLVRVKGLDGGQSVEVSIYDNYGNLVWKTTDEAPSGSKALDILWDGKNGKGDIVAGGVYVAVVDIDGEIFKRKIAVWKNNE